MNKHLTLFGSVAVLLSAFSLTACDSATATNEKKVADVAKPVAAAQQVVEKAADEPKAVVQAVVAAPKVEEATSEVEEAPAVAAATEEAKPDVAEIPKPEAVATTEEA